jgi:hypothetical protein
VGREPFYVSAGATTVVHGVGCSGDALVPTLMVDDLVLSSPFEVRIGNARAGGIGVIALGVPNPLPIRVSAGCWLYTHATPELLGPFAVTNGAAVWSAFLPNFVGLVGLEIALQGLSAPSTQAIGFDLSPGAFATIGT